MLLASSQTRQRLQCPIVLPPNPIIGSGERVSTLNPLREARSGVTIKQLPSAKRETMLTIDSGGTLITFRLT